MNHGGGSQLDSGRDACTCRHSRASGGRCSRAQAISSNIDFQYDFKSQHPLHDTVGHLNRLKEVLDTPELETHQARVQNEIDIIVDIIPKLLLPSDLPQRVVHGDPKISNILFEGQRAVGLIDLDTCNRHTVLVDLGDAVRSWCRDGSEDERHRFQIERFEAMLKGYAAEGPQLTLE